MKLSFLAWQSLEYGVSKLPHMEAVEGEAEATTQKKQSWKQKCQSQRRFQFYFWLHSP